MSSTILEVKNLTVQYNTDDGVAKAVNNVSFCIKENESLGLVGETGAGKTTTASCIMRLLPDPPGKITNGEIFYQGDDLLKKTDREMRKIRGEQISMIFQDPMTSLNPVLTVGDQIIEMVTLHSKLSKREAEEKAKQMLELVGIPRDRFYEYPQQFSGGMKQRVVIAIALICNPHLLIADEPTTALDVTIQFQVLQLIKELQSHLKTSLLLITHDLGVVAEMCDRVAVMYAGEIVEIGSAKEIFENAKHPYTIGLFNSIPNLDEDRDRLEEIDGLMPDPTDLPDGCKFAARCKYCTEACKRFVGDITQIADDHMVQCLLYSESGEVER